MTCRSFFENFSKVCCVATNMATCVEMYFLQGFPLIIGLRLGIPLKAVKFANVTYQSASQPEKIRVEVLTDMHK